jgi:hypothetical protein
MSNITHPLKVIYSKLAIQARIVLWKIKYVSEDMIRH